MSEFYHMSGKKSSENFIAGFNRRLRCNVLNIILPVCVTCHSERSEESDCTMRKLNCRQFTERGHLLRFLGESAPFEQCPQPIFLNSPSNNA